MQRFAVVGSTGAGKTRVARELARMLGVLHVELDSIYHQAGWTPLPDDEFRAAVEQVVQHDRWVVDGNYSAVRPLVMRRADTVVWLDFGRWTIMQRVVRRSAWRAGTRVELWNGNREHLRDWLSPEHPVRWAWSQYERRRAGYEEVLSSPELAQTTVLRFTRPSQAGKWLRSVTAPASEPTPRGAFGRRTLDSGG